VPCGWANLICPPGAGYPTLVEAGFYSNEDALENFRSSESSCEPGYFCPGDGRRYLCPAGTYADQDGTISTTCLGLCDPGYYCEAGSPSRRQIKCGGVSVYCPRGSTVPKIAHPGFYSINTGPDAGAIDLKDKMNLTRYIYQFRYIHVKL
jgi:hypothetical protein